jgi:septal ring-binding cell division protein DamX
MDENTKLYVFSRREVALIFLFILLVALTSFVLGVRIGKSFSYEASGLSPQDRERVDLLSNEEEKVNKVVEEIKKQEEVNTGEEESTIDQKKIKERLEDLIKEETSKETPKVEKAAPLLEASEEPQTKASVNEEQMIDDTVSENTASDKSGSAELSSKKYTGKYTIQLGSHQSLEEAKAFAEGFRVRGYDPIINEVELSDRGVWYRVSLGVFDTVTNAKNYVKKEKSLFQGQEYHFARFE